MADKRADYRDLIAENGKVTEVFYLEVHLCHFAAADMVIMETFRSYPPANICHIRWVATVLWRNRIGEERVGRNCALLGYRYHSCCCAYSVLAG